jgi:hypothetical protein
MTRTSTAMIRLSIVTIVGGAALFWNGEVPLDSRLSLVSSAQARIGRPLTPMSAHAGLLRRTTRRRWRMGAAGAVAVGAAAAYAGSGCADTGRGRLRPNVTVCQ